MEDCAECSNEVFLKSTIKLSKYENVIKLKGGHKPSKLPSGLCSFNSKYQLVNIISNIFRSLGDDWGFFSDHKLCSHSTKKETNFS